MADFVRLIDLNAGGSQQKKGLGILHPTFKLGPIKRPETLIGAEAEGCLSYGCPECDYHSEGGTTVRSQLLTLRAARAVSMSRAKISLPIVPRQFCPCLTL